MAGITECPAEQELESSMPARRDGEALLHHSLFGNRRVWHWDAASLFGVDRLPNLQVPHYLLRFVLN
jgi:hypothetical protein